MEIIVTELNLFSWISPKSSQKYPKYGAALTSIMSGESIDLQILRNKGCNGIFALVLTCVVIQMS